MELTQDQLNSLPQRLFLDTEDTKAEKIREERRIIHFISTPDIDRGRDIMKPKGMDAEDFLKTKTVFKNHNYDQAIGSNVKLVMINEGVKATTYFSKSMPGEDIYQMHLEGVINGWSIGFGPVRDKEGKIKDGSIEIDDKNGVRTFNEWILYEYSSTGIPMNPNALDIAKSICKSSEMLQEIQYKNDLILIHSVLSEQKKETETLKDLYLKASDSTKAVEITDIQKQIKILNKTLTAIVGSMSGKNIDISKELKKGFAGMLYDLTGRKPNNF